MQQYELLATHDSRKSFYGKAKVIISDEGTIFLKSYDTFVALIEPDGTYKKIWDGSTQTTNRHIKEFKKQFNISEV